MVKYTKVFQEIPQQRRERGNKDRKWEEGGMKQEREREKELKEERLK
jgi:hypothetical protein